MYRRTGAAIGLLVMLAAGLAGCADQTTQADDGRINAVATVGMLTDVVQNVGGEFVAVTGLMGAGVDPHLYRATPRNIQTLQAADVLFRGGLNLEGKMGEIFDRLGERLPVVAMGDAVPEDLLLAFPGHPGYHDPHIWFDVSLWARGVDEIADALSALDPAHAEVFAANAAAYSALLADLDAYVSQAIATIPENQRVMITAHDAFQYFGRRYGLEVTGLQGISTEAEASVQDVQALVDFIVERQVPAIFIESSVPARTLQAVQEAARSRGWQVNIPATLFSDSFGDAGTQEGTYIGMVLHNVGVIVTALGGTLPPLPASLTGFQPVLDRAAPSAAAAN